jgi:hypothetical protein
MRFLGDVGRLGPDQGHGLFTKEQFVDGVLQDLSVFLCCYNATLEHGVAGFCQSQWHWHKTWLDLAFG